MYSDKDEQDENEENISKENNKKENLKKIFTALDETLNNKYSKNVELGVLLVGVLLIIYLCYTVIPEMLKMMG